MSLMFAVPIVATTVVSSRAVKMVESIPVPPPTQRWSPATPVRSSPAPAFLPQPSPQVFPGSNYFRLRPTLPVSADWQYPLVRQGTLTSKFGWRIHPILGGRKFHAGLDLAAPSGTPVRAVTAATVRSAGRKGGYGLTIVLSHWDGRTQTLYGHLSKILVKPGQFIQPGQVIGHVGSTGRSTGPHLHFEVRRRRQGKWQAVNPQPLLRQHVKQRKLARP